MSTIPKPSDLTGTYAATYDAWNRLAFVWVDSNSDGDHDGGETVIARYEYDGRNRRTKIFANADTDDGFDSYQHFFYNSRWQILETRLSESENTEPEGLDVEMQYVWSARYIDAPVLRDRDADDDSETGDLGVTDSGLEERLYYLTDANMNVTCLVDTNGDAVERYVYDPYGNVTILNGASGVDKDGAVTEWTDDSSQVASDVANNILYCGYYFDDETGLYSVRNRYYHAQLGRWASRDPSGYVDGMNLYEYVGGEPTCLVDPSGRFWQILIILAGLLVAGCGDDEVAEEPEPVPVPEAAGPIVWELSPSTHKERSQMEGEYVEHSTLSGNANTFDPKTYGQAKRIYSFEDLGFFLWDSPGEGCCHCWFGNPVTITLVQTIKLSDRLKGLPKSHKFVLNHERKHVIDSARIFGLREYRQPTEAEVEAHNSQAESYNSTAPSSLGCKEWCRNHLKDVLLGKLSKMSKAMSDKARQRDATDYPTFAKILEKEMSR